MKDKMRVKRMVIMKGMREAEVWRGRACTGKK